VLPSDPQVLSASAQVDISGERRIQARSRLMPTLSLQTTQGRSSELEFGVPINRRSSRAETSLRWNVYNGGNDAAELRASVIDETAAEQELRRAQEDSAQRIGESYLDVLRLQTMVPRAAERLQAVQRLVDQTRRQADLGKMSDADAQQAEAALLDAEIGHEEMVADHLSARRKLARLIGAASLDELRPASAVALPLPAGGAAADSMAAMPPGALGAALQRARAARERVRPHASLLAPRIDIEMRKQLGDNTTPAYTSQTNNSWQVTARWDFPVGGEAQSRRDEVERRAEAAEAEAQRVERSLQAELSTLAPQVAQAERALAMIVRQIEQYSTLVRAGELQFEAGRRTLAQLITLRDSRFNAEKRLSEQAMRLQRARLSQLYYSGELLGALGVVGVPRSVPLGPPPTPPQPLLDKNSGDG
jgi:outer membrane protein TolC